MARILVIEDSPTQAAEAAFVLEDAGFEVAIAGDGLEGFECIKEGGFDLVLSDVIMPRMSGFELCRKVKDELPGVAVFLFTTLNRTVDILRGLECGADGYVNKPYEPDVLIERINNFLAIRARRAGTKGEGETVFDGQRFTMPAVPEHVLDYVVSVIAHCVRERETAGEGALQSAEALRRSEERFALSVSGANDGLWDWVLDTNDMYFSPRWKRILGYADGELESAIDAWRSRVHPDDREGLEAALAAHLAGSIPYFEHEHRLRHKAGGYRWVLARGLCTRNAAGAAARIAGSLTDITERRHMEEQLRTVSAELAAIVRALPDRYFLLHAAGAIVDSHSGWMNGNGSHPAGAPARHITEVLAPPAGEVVLEGLATARRTGALAEIEYTAATEQGERTYEVRVSPLPDELALAMVRDITDRKREEATLRLTQLSVDSAPDAIFWIGPDGRFLYVNDAAARSLGYARAELMAMSVHDVSPDTTPAVWPALWRNVKRYGCVYALSRNRRKDGTIVPVDFKARFVAFGGREYLCAFTRDTNQQALKELPLRDEDAPPGVVLTSVAEAVATLSRPERAGD